MAPVYVDGVKTVTLKGDAIAEEFQRIVEDYVVDALRRADRRPRNTAVRREARAS